MAFILKLRTNFSRAMRLAMWAGLVVTITTIGGWLILDGLEEAHVKRLVSEHQLQIESVLNHELTQVVDALGRMASRWETEDATSRKLWALEAANLVEDFGYFQAIEWADKSFIVQWIEPVEGNEAALGLDLGFEDRRRATLTEAKNSGKYTVTKSIDLVQGGKGFIVSYPIGSGDTFDGFIIGVFHTSALFAQLTNALQVDFAIDVYEDDKCIYSSGGVTDEKISIADHSHARSVEALGNEWHLVMSPSASYLSSIQSNVPGMFLVLGLLLALSVGGATYLGVDTLETHQHVRESEERFRFLAERMHDMLWSIDTDFLFTYVSPSCEPMLGYTPEELTGKPLAMVIGMESMTELKDYIAKVTQGELKGITYEASACTKSGEEIYLGMNASVIFDGSDVIMVQGISQDITEERAAKDALRKSESKYRLLSAELTHMSNTDALTGIPNRRALENGLVEEWKRAQRDHLSIGVILIDIDSFKQYNDNYGHQAGDECLRRVAQILDSKVQRAGDKLARYGGEEFIVILPNTDAQGVAIVAERLRKAIEDTNIPHEYAAISDHLTISSGGVAMIPTQDERYEILVEHADTALYRAKKNGRNQYLPYIELKVSSSNAESA